MIRLPSVTASYRKEISVTSSNSSLARSMIAARTEVVNDVDEVAQVAVLVEPSRGNAGGPQRGALEIGALQSIRL